MLRGFHPAAARLRSQFRLCCLLATSCLWTAGCPKEPTTPTILDQRAQPFVQDVPVPKSFELDGRKSEHKIIAGRRSVNHYYRGSDSQLSVKNFYMHYMPLSQWQLVKDDLFGGVFVLNFKKNEEKCEIRIEQVPAGLFGKPTLIRATVKSIYAETPAD